MDQFNQFAKKAGAVILAGSVVFSSLGGDAAAAEDQKIITVTPFENQWKYFGQTKTFIMNEHYSLSEDVEPGNIQWTLGIADESVGNQPYVLKGTTQDSDYSFSLAENAPGFEVKEYVTDAEAHSYKTSDSEEEWDISVYSRSRESVEIQAPEGYLISDKISAEDSNWSEGIETGAMQEGENQISYYLRSNLDDSTRKAIDQTKKEVTIKVDSIAPRIKELIGGDSSDVEAEGSISIEGPDSATYYYIVLPADNTQELTTDAIKENVTSGIGIVGFGHVDDSQEAALNINGLTANTNYIIYAFLEDIAGNVSAVAESNVFSTQKIALTGEVEVSGEPELDSTLTLEPKQIPADAGALEYQWYRIKLTEDEEEFDAAWDETGGAEEDDLEADYDDDDDEDDDEDEDEDDVADFSSAKKRAGDYEEVDDEITTLDGAELIEGATSDTYQITKEDIGCRLIASVRAENYSGYLAGSTLTFVPKLMPEYNIPKINSRVYSPVRKLSSTKLPAQWSWVDKTIVPVYGNSGYRAKFVPSDTSMYKSVIVRVKIPITKKALKKSMISVRKTNMYTGKAIQDNFTIKVKKKKLAPKKDYRAEYFNNIKLGKAIVKIRGVGNYKGDLKITYEITKRSMSSVKCQYEDVKVYTGKPITVALKVKNGNVRMKNAQDYTVTYQNNTEIGQASIVLQGKGNYRGKKTLKFSIVPRKPDITKVKKVGQKLRLTLSKEKDITGYRVYMSSSKSFSKEKTQRYIITGTGFGIKKVNPGTWYMRVKAYTVRNGKTYMSSYSKMKKVKIL